MGRGARKDPSALRATPGSRGRYCSSATSGRCEVFLQAAGRRRLVSIYLAGGKSGPKAAPPPPLGGSLGDPALGVSRLFPPPPWGSELERKKSEP